MIHGNLYRIITAGNGLLGQTVALRPQHHRQLFLLPQKRIVNGKGILPQGHGGGGKALFLQKRLPGVRHIGAVFQSLGALVARAEVLTEVEPAGHVLDAHDLCHMGGVAGQHLRRLQGRVREDEGVVDIQPHHAAGVPDGAEHVVGEIPPVGAQTRLPGIGVGRRHRQLRTALYPAFP